MATKRAWLSRLAKLKAEPRPLTPAECDELRLLLGGTTRPKHRPELLFRLHDGSKVSRRQTNWTAIGNVVFSIMASDQSIRNRAEAERAASRWFEARGVSLTPKQIKNELDAIRQRAGLRRLGLAEWEDLTASRK